MKSCIQKILAGGLFSAILLGVHAWYFGGMVVVADVAVWGLSVAGWAWLVSCASAQSPIVGVETGNHTGRFIRESNAFHQQLGNEISGQLTSANTELGNTQILLNDAITKLIGNFINISDEVRNLSCNTDKFSKQIHQLIVELDQALQQAERSVAGLALQDDNQRRDSQAHIQSMIVGMSRFGETVTENAAELNLISGKVEQNVLVVISSLQFQDMSSQLIEHARMRMQALQEVADEMAKAGKPGSRDYLERIAAYNRLLEKHVVSLDKQKINPVAQTEYRSGDVELF